MYKFALRNLWSRPLRSILSLVGMAVAIVLIMGLVSFSQGIRKLVRESLGQVEGLIVVQEANPDPMFSTLPADLQVELEAIDGVRVVSPEVWFLAVRIEGEAAFKYGTSAHKYSAVVLGLDPERANEVERSAIFRRSIVEGRYIAAGDEGRCILSKEIADQFSKSLGDSIEVGGRDYEIVGIFRTGSMVFDRILISDIGTVRKVAGKDEHHVSAFYVEPSDPERIAEIEKAIEGRVEGVEAHTTDEMNAYASSWLERLDIFLLIITILPIVGGAVAILNTMLMSFGERIKEFGVMRACGWTRRDLVGLVLYESAYLGFLGGVVGIVLGYAGTAGVAAALLIEPVTPLWLPAACLGLSTILGTVGGTYPAAKAARMDPIRAIKYE